MRQEIPIVVLGADGRPYAGASVAVRTDPGGTDATIYQAKTGGATHPNPRISDAQGRVEGWLERGDYAATISSVAGLGPWVESFPIISGLDVLPPIIGNYSTRPAIGTVLDGQRFIAPDKGMEWVASAGAWVLVNAIAVKVATIPAAAPAGPLSAPIDGQRISYQAAGLMATQGLRWELAFEAALSRWLPAGACPPIVGLVATGQGAFLYPNYGDLATVGPDVTTPAAGDYMLTGSADLVNRASYGNSYAYADVAVGGVGPSNAAPAPLIGDYQAYANTSHNMHGLTKTRKLAGLAAATLIRMKYMSYDSNYLSSTASTSFVDRRLALEPLALVSP